MAEKVKSKRAKVDASEGSTVSELLRFFLEERKQEKRQKTRDQQFLQVIESMAERKADEDKRREERRREDEKERDERLVEGRRIFA